MTNRQGLLGIALIALVAGAIYLSIPSRTTVQPVQPSTRVELKNGDHYTLVAQRVTGTIAGKEQAMLSYNGMIPGPEIHVAQGATVTITVKNDTDIPTLLHSHGVRMDNADDGSQLQQQDIAPGESYTYTLTVPDAGVFWYHPHAQEVYSQALGMYGAFVVTPTDPTYYPPTNSEHVLFLSDLPVRNGVIGLTPDSKDQVLMGHFGTVLLANGQEQYTLTAKTREVVRLDVINAANVRPFNFAISGTKLKLVGGDNGAYEKASWQDNIVLGPSERAIVDVLFDKAGTYTIENRIPSGTKVMGTIAVEQGTVAPSLTDAFNSLQENKTVEFSIDPFRSYFTKSPDKKLVLSVDFSGMMAGHMSAMGTMGAPAGGIEWDGSDQMMQMMNSMSTTDEVKWKITDAATGKSNMDIDWTLKRGQPVKIEIYNDPNTPHPMQHPIHFHGQRFLVVSRDGVMQKDLVWKDTVLVKAGETVDIVLDPSNPGTWMAHCHIAEHLVAGMMFSYKVE